MNALITEVRELTREGSDDDVLTVDRGWLRRLLASYDAHAEALACLAAPFLGLGDKP